MPKNSPWRNEEERIASCDETTARSFASLLAAWDPERSFACRHALSLARLSPGEVVCRHCGSSLHEERYYENGVPFCADCARRRGMNSLYREVHGA